MRAADKITAFRNELLVQTLHYAVSESSYYQRMLRDFKEVQTVEDLSFLPIINKQIMLENMEEILIRPQANDLLSFSSGTTSGQPFVVRRSPNEVAQIIKYRELAHQYRKDDTVPLILELVDNYHSISFAPTINNAIRIPCSAREHLRWVEQMLSTSFEFAGVETKISVIRTPLTILQRLTMYFLQEGVCPGQFGVKQIATSGFPISSKWQRFLTEQWEATLVDTYSLSEFAANGAVTCENCGYSHFTIPTLIPEIVCPNTKQPVETGLGVLVLTSLYPFAQRQLFIRYWTGDLVERGPKCERDEVGFQVKGRMSQSLLMGGSSTVKPLILAIDLHDILDALPELNRPFESGEAEYLDQSLLQMISHKMPVRFTLTPRTDRPQLLRLEIGVNFVTEMFPERASVISSNLISELSARNHHLVQVLEAGLVELEVRLAAPYESVPIIEI